MAKLIGTDPNQVPTNGDLGDLAYQNKESVRVDNLVVNTEVGIGTSTPDCALKVDGKNSTSITSGWNRTAVIKDRWPTFALFSSGSGSGSSAGFAYNGDSTKLDFIVGGTETDLLDDSIDNRPLMISTSEVVVNDRSNDCDFRVESDTTTHALFVQGDTGNVGINASNPTDARFRIHGGSTAESQTMTMSAGSSNPVQLSMYNGYGTRQGVVFLNNGSSAYSSFGMISENTSLTFKTAAYNVSNSSDLTTDWIERMRITNSGHVEIRNDANAPMNSSNSPGSLKFRGNGWNTSFGSQTTLWNIRSDSAYSSYSGQTYPILKFDVTTTNPTGGSGNGGGRNDETIFSIQAAGSYTCDNYTGVFQNGLIVNEASVDADFRVESVNKTHMLFVDAGNNRVGIGESTPDNMVHIYTGQNYDTGIRLQGISHYWDINAGEGGYSSSALNLRYNGTRIWRVMQDSTTTFYMNLTVNGSLSKNSGSFKIDHPLPEKTETHHLVHSFVEAPQADNIYRGKVDLVDGSATVNIDTVAGMTEGTFAALNREVQCFTSNESDWDAVRGSVSGNTLTIECQNTSSTATISWLVIGERQDQHMYDTDWTDANGKVIVEPEKEDDPED